jgi:hypothetical protein
LFICDGFLLRGFDHGEILIMLGKLLWGRNGGTTSESISGMETLSIFFSIGAIPMCFHSIL